jgi:hypothetical protein
LLKDEQTSKHGGGGRYDAIFRVQFLEFKRGANKKFMRKKDKKLMRKRMKERKKEEKKKKKYEYV